MQAAYPAISLGETAEVVAERWEVSREAQDALGLASQRRAVAAQAEGRFDAQIVPVSIPQRKGDPIVVAHDEHPRADTTPEALAKLRPAFREGGSVTAGNSSGINDGAAAVLVVEAAVAREMGLTPLARVVSTAVAGVDPSVMGIGPVPATRKALARAGIKVADLDRRDERGVRQPVRGVRTRAGTRPGEAERGRGRDRSRLPGNGGARLVTMLVHGLARDGGRYGLATMCIGVGQGIATVVERIEGSGGLQPRLDTRPGAAAGRSVAGAGHEGRAADLDDVHLARDVPDRVRAPGVRTASRSIIVVSGSSRISTTQPLGER